MLYQLSYSGVSEPVRAATEGLIRRGSGLVQGLFGLLGPAGRGALDAPSRRGDTGRRWMTRHDGGARRSRNAGPAGPEMPPARPAHPRGARRASGRVRSSSCAARTRWPPSTSRTCCGKPATPSSRRGGTGAKRASPSAKAEGPARGDDGRQDQMPKARVDPRQQQRGLRTVKTNSLRDPHLRPRGLRRRLSRNSTAAARKISWPARPTSTGCARATSPTRTPSRPA